MKKIIVLLLSVLMVFSLVACGNQSAEKDSPTSKPAEKSADPVQTQEPSQEPSQQPDQQAPENSDLESSEESTENSDAAGGKTLVVYYSATGNTKDAADYIAEATNGDVFELKPEDPYSDDDLDWTDKNSRVVDEHDHPEKRAVKLEESTVSNWDSYDTVFIGYPIWWGIAAWPVDSFIEDNDFTGKTVVPFCTSTSSGLGRSGELLEEAAGTGNWLEGQRFSSNASKQTVQDWVESLGL